MSNGEKLATKFEEANNQIVATTEGATEQQWSAASPEGWTSGVTLHHIAESYDGLAQMMKAIAKGGELPALTQEMLDRGNAEHASRAANATPAETAQILRDSGTGIAELLRSLTDEELARRAKMPIGDAELSAYEVAEAVLVGHGLGHLKGVKSAMATA